MFTSKKHCIILKLRLWAFQWCFRLHSRVTHHWAPLSWNFGAKLQLVHFPAEQNRHRFMFSHWILFMIMSKTLNSRSFWFSLIGQDPPRVHLPSLCTVDIDGACRPQLVSRYVDLVANCPPHDESFHANPACCVEGCWQFCFWNDPTKRSRRGWCLVTLGAIQRRGYGEVDTWRGTLI